MFLCLVYVRVFPNVRLAKGAHMFMLLFIGTFLCPSLGNTMNLHYLGSLRKIEQIWNYD